MVTIQFLTLFCAALAVGPGQFEPEEAEECTIPDGSSVLVLTGEDGPEQAYAAEMIHGLAVIKKGK